METELSVLGWGVKSNQTHGCAGHLDRTQTMKDPDSTRLKMTLLLFPQCKSHPLDLGNW